MPIGTAQGGQVALRHICGYGGLSGILFVLQALSIRHMCSKIGKSSMSLHCAVQELRRNVDTSALPVIRLLMHCDK